MGLISNIENLTDVLVLGWESLVKPYRKPWTALLCIAWVRTPPNLLTHLFNILSSRICHLGLFTQDALKCFVLLTLTDLRPRLPSTL